MRIADLRRAHPGWTWTYDRPTATYRGARGDERVAVYGSTPLGVDDSSGVWKVWHVRRADGAVEHFALWTLRESLRA